MISADNPSISTAVDFSELRDRSVEELAGFSPSEIAIPPQFARRRRPEKVGELLIENRFFELPGRGEWRSVILNSPKIRIISQFFFPSPNNDLPLYAMEFVVLGPRPIVGVIDAVCLAPDASGAAELSALLRGTRAAFPDLAQATDMPTWYEQCRSGDDFFVRPRTMNDVASLSAAHLHMVRGIKPLLAEPAPLPEPRASIHDAALRHYKQHHSDNSPGLRLLNRSFGNTWTGQYMSNWIFG